MRPTTNDTLAACSAAARRALAAAQEALQAAEQAPAGDARTDMYFAAAYASLAAGAAADAAGMAGWDLQNPDYENSRQYKVIQQAANAAAKSLSAETHAGWAHMRGATFAAARQAAEAALAQAIKANLPAWTSDRQIASEAAVAIYAARMESTRGTRK